MFRRFIAWAKSFFVKPAPVPNLMDEYHATWARRGYKDEEEYRDYLLKSLKLTESEVELAPNHVYSADDMTSFKPVGRYYPGVEEIDTDANNIGVWNEDNKFVLPIADEIERNRGAIAASLVDVIKQ